MNIFNVILKILLCLLMVSPILGATGLFPPPTPDLYNTPEAFAFIDMLFQTGFVLYIEAFVFAVSIALVIANRMAIAALLILPITVNIIAFHLTLDGGLLTAGAVLADILLVLNLYFLWQNREVYKTLWRASAPESASPAATP